MNTQSNGQTIIEVIVAVGLVVLLTTGLLSGTTSALRAREVSQSKTQAIKYAQEGLELTRKLRDEDWAAFRGNIGDKCLDESGQWSDPPCLYSLSSNKFNRTVNFNWSGGPQPHMTVIVTVSWKEGSLIKSSKLSTFFTDWRS